MRKRSRKVRIMFDSIWRKANRRARKANKIYRVTMEWFANPLTWEDHSRYWEVLGEKSRTFCERDGKRSAEKAIDMARQALRG